MDEPRPRTRPAPQGNVDHRRRPRPLRPGLLADHPRRHHTGRAAARPPHRTPRPLPRRPAQRPRLAAQGRDRAARGVRTAVRPRLEPPGQDRRHADLPRTRRARGHTAPLRRHRTRQPAWRVWGGYPSEPHWQARFSSGTPTPLVAAFTASLISTEPVHRTVQDVPSHTRRHLYVAAPAPAKQTPGPLPVAPPPQSPGPGRSL
ncbi:DUF317 domain-containing protein [Streptomyces sp. C10-9-1]|uniref:DUF317 domain-containing protein n=1 Tax=Streptomyces sp. C10-9-1 TaxID=1859285 RepID=UPI003F4A02C7